MSGDYGKKIYLDYFLGDTRLNWDGQLFEFYIRLGGWGKLRFFTW